MRANPFSISSFGGENEPGFGNRSVSLSRGDASVLLHNQDKEPWTVFPWRSIFTCFSTVDIIRSSVCCYVTRWWSELSYHYSWRVWVRQIASGSVLKRVIGSINPQNLCKLYSKHWRVPTVYKYCLSFSQYQLQSINPASTIGVTNTTNRPS